MVDHNTNDFKQQHNTIILVAVDALQLPSTSVVPTTTTTTTTTPRRRIAERGSIAASESLERCWTTTTGADASTRLRSLRSRRRWSSRHHRREMVLLHSSSSSSSSSSSDKDRTNVKPSKKKNNNKKKKTETETEHLDEYKYYDYDMVVIGAGASGMFGAGAATSLGAKTLLIDRCFKTGGEVADTSIATTPSNDDGRRNGGGGGGNDDFDDVTNSAAESSSTKATTTTTTTTTPSNSNSNNNNIGGDCTNAACVPSKAVRSVAKIAAASAAAVSSSPSSPLLSLSSSSSSSSSSYWLQLARSHATRTINKVKEREDPIEMIKRTTNNKLDIMLVSSCPRCRNHHHQNTPNGHRQSSMDSSSGGVQFVSPYELQLNTNNNGNNDDDDESVRHCSYFVEKYLSGDYDDDRSKNNSDDDNNNISNDDGDCDSSKFTESVENRRWQQQPRKKHDDDDGVIIRIRSKKFLIATGSGPKQEPVIEQTAQQVGIPVYTYRTILQQQQHQQQQIGTATNTSNNGNRGIWGIFDDGGTEEEDRMTTTKRSSNDTKTIVIAGGGATALELGQSLARLCNGGDAGALTNKSTNNVADTRFNARIYIVAPQLLKGEDTALQQAAYNILDNERGIDLTYLGYRVDQCCWTSLSTKDDIKETTRSVELVKAGQILTGSNSSNTRTGTEATTTTTYIQNVDAIVLATGRQPGLDLASLQLDNAQVEWNTTHGVFVKPSTLQSTTQPHIYACGDCAYPVGDGRTAISNKETSRMRKMTATHAAWTGYHAVSNALLPKWLTFGSKAIHDVVPRVIYTDPELVSVGMSEQECIEKYGERGFQQLHVSENGTDRSDIDSLERPTPKNSIGFVELRATLVDGRVVGFTACGPTASELANQMSVVITNKLTVRQIAKSLHSYPSYGYLLHRVALSMALNDMWGSLEACGPVGSCLAKVGRLVTKCVLRLRKMYNKLAWFLPSPFHLIKEKLGTGRSSVVREV